MAGEIIYSVFVSSTYEDLREERAAVQKALLLLHCMPIGMERFGSADEETWDFIQRQIANCDYYVVLIADRYGSTAADGLSYTEKEYDYAREIKKPVLAFVHADRGSIPRDKTEKDPDNRTKLEGFIEKVRERSPVSVFTSPDDLATKVLASFVKQRERTPAVGFIRADQAPDLKRYTELLEENLLLRTELSKLERYDLTPFPEAFDEINLTSITIQPHAEFHAKVSWGELFVFVAEQILTGRDREIDISSKLSQFISSGPPGTITHPQIDQIKILFVLRRLIEIDRVRSAERQLLVWKLTRYGQAQYGLLASAKLADVGEPWNSEGRGSLADPDTGGA